MWESNYITRMDVEALSRWMDTAGLPGRGDLARVKPLSGGSQNELYLVDRGGEQMVLRRPPARDVEASARVLMREARLLRALAGTDVPHARLRGVTEDADVIGAPFYVMDLVDGWSPMNGGWAAPYDTDLDARGGLAIELVDGAARMARVDWKAQGLDGFGKPDGFLERQVPRWLAELQSYGRHDGYPGPDIPHLDEVAAWLEANRPAPAPPGLLHGDFHVANLLYRFDGPDLAAVVDWEMSTVGDPLLDLGWLLATWPAEGPLSVESGLPTKTELVARYTDRSRRDTSAAGWYEVLACFRLGIILEGTHARAFAGKAPVATGDLLHATTLELFRRAHALTDGG